MTAVVSQAAARQVRRTVLPRYRRGAVDGPIHADVEIRT
jgi:hypothetical protein